MFSGASNLAEGVDRGVYIHLRRFFYFYDRNRSANHLYPDPFFTEKE